MSDAQTETIEGEFLHDQNPEIVGVVAAALPPAPLYSRDDFLG